MFILLVNFRWSFACLVLKYRVLWYYEVHIVEIGIETCQFVTWYQS